MSELQSADMVEKLKDNFDEMVVYKDLKKSNFITSFKMPSFMRDWVLKRFQDDDGEIDVDGATAFIREFIPKKEDWKSIKNRIVNYQEQMKFWPRYRLILISRRRVCLSRFLILA